jgi:arsenate reductase
VVELKVYAYPKCGTCRNAIKWLKEQGHTVNEVHIVEQPPSVEELKSLVKLSGLELKKWFNVSGNLYKEMALKDKLPEMKEEEQLQLLASHGMLIKRPVVTDGRRVTIGFKEDEYQKMWGHDG